MRYFGNKETHLQAKDCFVEAEKLSNYVLNNPDLFAAPLVFDLMKVHYSLGVLYLDQVQRITDDVELVSSSFKQAKGHCRQLLKAISCFLIDEDAVVSHQALRLFKQQTAHLYIKALSTEGQVFSTKSNEPLKLRLAMLISDFDRYDLPKEGEYVSVLSQFYQLLPKKGPNVLDEWGRVTYLKRVFKGYSFFWDFFQQNSLKQSFQVTNKIDRLVKQAYQQATYAEVEKKLPVDVLRDLYCWLSGYDSRILVTRDGIKQHFSDDVEQLDGINLNQLLTKGVEPVSDSMFCFGDVDFIEQSVIVNGEQALGCELTCGRVYPKKRLPNAVSANKENVLELFCHNNNIIINLDPHKSLAAMIDFSALDFTAYESKHPLPSLYNLLLWMFDDRIDEKIDITDEDIQTIKYNLATIVAILSFEESCDIDTQRDSDLIKVAKGVAQKLGEFDQDKQFWKGFVQATKATFDAQVRQAQRKQKGLVLSPSAFMAERMFFSGVDPSLHLSARLSRIETLDILEDEVIKLYWKEVNVAVSNDNCGDSFVKEFDKEKDTENHVFVLYADYLFKQFIDQLKINVPTIEIDDRLGTNDLLDQLEGHVLPDSLQACITTCFGSQVNPAALLAFYRSIELQQVVQSVIDQKKVIATLFLLDTDVKKDAVKKAFYDNGQSVNDVLFKLYGLSSCRLQGRDKSFDTAIFTGDNWLRALGWSKETVRYFFNKDSQKFEHALRSYLNEKIGMVTR